MNLVQRIAVALTLLAVAAPAMAHEFWLELSSYAPRIGDEVDVHVFNGDGIVNGAEFKRNDKHIKRFWVVTPTGERDVLGVNGYEPAGLFRVEQSGMHIVAYSSNPTIIKLPAARFEAYLKDEGLENISALRKQRGETGTEGREAFVRCAKAIFMVDDHTTSDFDKRLDLPLEVIPLNNPLAARDGNVRVQILFQGRPLENAKVLAMRRETPELKPIILDTRSDAEGNASFHLDTGGQWLISAVHMVEAKDNVNADWQSYWASLSFEAMAPNAAAPRSRPVER